MWPKQSLVIGLLYFVPACMSHPPPPPPPPPLYQPTRNQYVSNPYTACLHCWLRYTMALMCESTHPKQYRRPLTTPLKPQPPSRRAQHSRLNTLYTLATVSPCNSDLCGESVTTHTSAATPKGKICSEVCSRNKESLRVATILQIKESFDIKERVGVVVDQTRLLSKKVGGIYVFIYRGN